MTAIKNKVLSNNLFFAEFAAFVAISFKLDSLIPLLIGCMVYSIELAYEIYSQIKNDMAVLIAKEILGIISLFLIMFLIVGGNIL